MANEITFGYAIGKTLTYGVYQADGTIRTSAGTSLTEVAGTGYYKATDGNVVVSDIVVVKEGSDVRGWGEYRPETNMVLIEGSDATDTIIGGDGDTLETLSDQMDVLSAQGSQVKNVYGPGE